MSDKSYALGEPELYSASALRDYIGNVRKLFRPLGNELSLAAEELEAALAYAPGGHWAAMGMDQKVKARMVAKHLHSAAEAANLVVVSSIRSYLSYRKHFQPGVPPAGRRRAFQHDDSADYRPGDFAA